MVRSWLDKNQAALRERFSNLGHIIVWMEQMTTRRFIVVAAEEFIIVSLCTLMCLYFGKIVVWYCCLYGAQNEVYNDDWVKSGLIVLCFS